MALHLRVALGLVVAAVLSHAAFGDGESDELSEEEMSGLMDQLVHTFERNMEESTGAQMRQAARRLATTKTKDGEGKMPDVSYRTVCEQTCWSSLTTEFQTALLTLDNPQCKLKKNIEKVEKVKQKKQDAAAKKEQKKQAKTGGGASGGGKKGGGAGGGNKRRLDSFVSRFLATSNKPPMRPGAPKRDAVVKEESACIFDLCAKPQFQTMCANVSGIGDNFEVDECKKANAVFICNSICSPQCPQGGVVQTMLCGKDKDAAGGKFDSQMGGGDLKSMFNSMCMYNDAEDMYCYDQIKEEIRQAKFTKGQDDTKFPDPCAATCSDPLGASVTRLGCCFPAFMDVARKYKVLKRGAVRNAKAVAAKCSKSVAFTGCTNGTLTKARSKQFKLNTSTVCDTLSNETTEDTFLTTMGDQLNLTVGDVEMLTCKAKGRKCDARRLSAEVPRTLQGVRQLSETGSEIEINVQVLGEDADSALASLEVWMANASFTSSLVETSGEVATVDEADTGADSAMVSSAPVGRTSSFVLSAFLGLAWVTC